MSLPGAALAEFLQRHVPDGPRVELCVALSGGVDSTALLLAAVELRDACARDTAGSASREVPPQGARTVAVRAVHVHHGLNPEAGRWQGQCAELCAMHRVPLDVLAVEVQRRGAHGLEAAARTARYDALRRELRPDEGLLTAHQADDQLETVLIQLLRGAGVAGLAAMPALARFGAGWHGRPLLGLRRADLADFVATAGLAPVADPMNDDARFDRGYLRQAVLPVLRARWPAAAVTVARSATHCAAAQSLLEEIAAGDAREALDGARLRLAPLAALDRARRVNVLRWWLAREGLVVPSTARLDEAVRQMWSAAPESQPVVRWRGGELRRYRGALYALAAPPVAVAVEGAQILSPGGTVKPGAGLGALSLQPAVGAGLRAVCCAAGLTVRSRCGGEEIRLHREGPRRPLRLLLQEAGVVPWRRASLPLLWSAEELVAVADRWISADHAAVAGEPGYTPVWVEAPPLF